MSELKYSLRALLYINQDKSNMEEVVHLKRIENTSFEITSLMLLTNTKIVLPRFTNQRQHVQVENELLLLRNYYLHILISALTVNSMASMSI